jgi:hypothetical protein
MHVGVGDGLGDDMTQPVPVRLGLYYPFVQFRSDSWLKLAALYWDKVGRIVPPGYVLRDSETVRRLQGELGFVEDLAPSGRQLNSVGGEFVELIAERGPELSQLYGIQGFVLPDPMPETKSWPQPWTNVALSSLGGPQAPVDPSPAPDADPRLAYIFAGGKMTGELKHALVEAGLGVPVRDHSLIGLHPQLALVYMRALASQMATSVMCPLADDDFDHLVAGYAADRIASALLDIPADHAAPDGDPSPPDLDFAMLAVQSVIPKDISSIPVQKIIEIRQRHSEELTAFQQATDTIIGAIPEVAASASPEIRALYLQNLYVKTLEPELQRLKKSLHQSGIDAVFGAMNVKVQAPQLATSAAAVFGIGAMHLNPVMMGTGAIIMCFIPRIRRQQAQAQRLRADSPAAFLLRLEEELSPTSLASAMAKKATHFLTA